MPAEWASHEATWISWPHNPETWPDLLPDVEATMVELVSAITPHEHVHINVLSQSHREHVAQQLSRSAPSEQLTFHEIRTDDAWIRDHGAIFVRTDSGARAALDFDFNAWGGKYPPWESDAAVAAQMVARVGLCFPALDGKR